MKKKSAMEISDELAIVMPKQSQQMNNCGTCTYWKPFTNFEYAPNSGECSVISEKVTADVKYGWDGGYVQGYETEEDFGCTLWEGK